MSRLTRRGVLSGPKSAGKTYAQFQAHIATLPSLGFKAWGSASYGLSGAVGTAGSYIVRGFIGNEGVMAGTSWFDGSLIGAFTDASTNTGPTVIHGLPSLAEATNQKTNSYEVYVTVEVIATASRAGLTRNGFTSTSTGFTADRKITKILYWDGTQAMQMNPSTGTGPTPYTW